MNFIFDFGNVLVKFKPLEYLSGLFSDEKTIERINKVVFMSREWLDMDRGLITHKEAVEFFCARAPEYENEIRLAFKNATDIVSPINETINLLPEVKNRGHKLYYLSNMQKEMCDFLLENHKYIDLFDGGVFSCDINIIKPSPEIYRFLIDKYNLIPEECIFFDDMEENVTAAEKEGIKGILFATAADVLEYLQ